MEELEVLIKKQEQVEKDINFYQEQIDAYSSNISNLEDKKIDLKITYKELIEEYDKVKDSENDTDKQRAQELRAKMAKTAIEYKDIQNNLISNEKSIADLKISSDFEKIKNDNLKEQIANHPQTKVVETTQLEKELQQKLSKAKEQKNKIEEGLNKEIKSIGDIDHSLIDIIKNNPSYKHYNELLSKANLKLYNFKNKGVEQKYIDEIEDKINSLKGRQLTCAIDELRKESLKQDVIIDNAYDHIKELTISRTDAYKEIDSMRNGKYDQDTKTDENSKNDKDDKGNDSDKDKDQNQEKNDKDNNTEKDNANDSSNQNNNKDKDEDENKNKNKKIDDDTETKAGKPAKRSFFKNIFSKASEIINKIKDRLPKSKAKKEQEQKEAEEKARKEQEQKEAEEKAKKEQEQKKHKNRHYDEHDFDDNEIYKKRVDEYLNNFEKKVKNAHKEAVRYREEHDFDD